METNNKKQIAKFFSKKRISIIRIILLVIIIFSAVLGIFVSEGGPIGLPILGVSIAAFLMLRDSQITDSEFYKILDNIITDNEISISQNTICAFDLKNATNKRLKNGEIVSSAYYITDISITSSETAVFDVRVIDLLDQSVSENTYTITKNTNDVSFAEEEIKTDFGQKNVGYLRLKSYDLSIPVLINDYNVSEIIKSFFAWYEEK